MTNHSHLMQEITLHTKGLIESATLNYDEVTVECSVEHVKELFSCLKKHASFAFDELIDVCGVDYLLYGISDWETQVATEEGFSRGVERQPRCANATEFPRFAVVYHFLSTAHNHRLRVKVRLHADNLLLPSVCYLWKSANWFEREAYDLYGILFEGHPDLRRILTDYGFIGHPFRKDFPLSGHVEMRYDATLQKVIYEPVDIQPRITMPKVIRQVGSSESAEASKS